MAYTMTPIPAEKVSAIAKNGPIMNNEMKNTRNKMSAIRMDRPSSVWQKEITLSRKDVPFFTMNTSLGIIEDGK